MSHTDESNPEIFRLRQEVSRLASELKRAEDTYRRLMEGAGDAILILQDGRIKFLNPKTSELTGYPAKKLKAVPFIEFVHPDDRATIMAAHDRLLHDRVIITSYAFRVLHRTGRIGWGQANAAVVEWEGRDGILCFVRDVTAQKAAETAIRRTHSELELTVEQRTRDLMEANRALKKRIAEHQRTLKALQKSEKIYRMLFNSARDGVLVLNTAGEITDASQGAELLFGYPSETLMGRRLLEFVAPASTAAVEAHLGAMQKRTALEDEVKMVRRDGTVVDIWCKCTSITDSRGRTEGALAYCRDITRTKVLREQLIRSERLAATGQLAASVAHEINSPLQGVIGLIDVMKKTHGNDPTLSKNLNLLEGAFDSIRKTVRNLLDLNRPAKLLQQSMDLNRIVEDTVALVRSSLKKNRIRVRLNLHDDLPRIVGSPQQISQVIMNLINNAVEAMNGVGLNEKWDDFTARGGELTFKTDARKDKVMVEISDTGPGISKEDQQHIFDPFYTSKKKMGMGVGLTVCHGIVTEHQGTIMAENAPGGGAVFSIELPVPHPRVLTKNLRTRAKQI
jgi:PAS domain S-box-containing protein